MERNIIILSQVCQALVFLHTSTPPLAHLDVKPANIMVRLSNVARCSVLPGILKGCFSINFLMWAKALFQAPPKPHPPNMPYPRGSTLATVFWFQGIECPNSYRICRNLAAATFSFKAPRCGDSSRAVSKERATLEISPHDKGRRLPCSNILRAGNYLRYGEISSKYGIHICFNKLWVLLTSLSACVKLIVQLHFWERKFKGVPHINLSRKWSICLWFNVCTAAAIVVTQIKTILQLYRWILRPSMLYWQTLD